LHGRNTMLSGVTARRMMMTTLNQTTTTSTSLMSVLFVALLGGMILFVAGHAQSQTLHDAAHDVRHATGFPCH
jgi:cobalt transporter subunit CbtB